MHFELFEELIVVLALAIGIILLFRRFKLPGVLGFIIAGMIAGPHGLGWVAAVEEVETLAEMGVIFLLFVIGMEFSLKKLASIGVTVFVGGSLQAILTTLLVTGIGRLLGLPLPAAVFTGFLVTLSSTAIVLRILQEKGRMDSPFGRTSAAILIFQDILVVPMMLLTPMLAGRSKDIGHDLLVLAGKMLLLVVVVYVAGRFAVPRLLRTVSKGRNKELFLITIVVLCFAAAWGTSALGLSLALGAFFAGLIISETDQAYHATGIVQPFHELFMSFFFVSIGMLVDPGLFVTRPFLVLGLALLVVAVKVVATFLGVWLLRQPVRTALLTALALFQVGEFAFVLAMAGIGMGLLSREHHQLFLAVSILTMGATPFALQYADDIVRRVFTVFLPRGVAERLDRLMRVRRAEEKEEKRALRDHVVIVGFGLNGQNVARAAQSSRIRCAVIEEDPDLVEKAAGMGLHVVLGDATNDHVLEKAHVEQARVVVVAIADAEATRHIVSRVRAHTAAHLIVRTRYVHEIDANLALGANEVIPEEFETSIEIFHRVLRRYLVPEPQIQGITAHFRGAHYGVLRGADPKRTTGARAPAPEIPGLEIATIPVSLGRSRIVGHTLAEVDLKGRFGITVLAIRRQQRTLANPDAGERIRPDDVLYVLGSPDSIVRLDQALH